MDQPINKKRKRFRQVALYGVVLLAASALLMAIYRDPSTSRLNVQKERLRFDTVRTSDFSESITLFGVVEPIKTVYLDAVESGKVEAILVEDGNLVGVNDPIIQLSNLDLQLNVLNQEAQIVDQINTIRNQTILMEQQSLSLKENALDVRYRLDQLDKQLLRNRKLYGDSVIAQVEFEETEDEHEHLLRRQQLLRSTLQKDSTYHAMQKQQMETSLELMQRNLDFAKNSLENLRVRAPIAGQLSSLNIEIGQLLNKGERIAQIDVLSDYKIRAKVDQYYISNIFPGLKAEMVLDETNYLLQIKKVYPEVKDGAFEIDLVFVDTPPTTIRRGQSVPFKLKLSDASQALVLAKGGFTKASGGKWVYVVEQDGAFARKRPIQIGRKSATGFEVLGGLAEGEVVLISSYDNYGEKDELYFN